LRQHGFLVFLEIVGSAAWTPVDCSEIFQLHQQPVNVVLCPTFIRKLYYKLTSVVTFTFMQIFDQMSSLLNGIKAAAFA